MLIMAVTITMQVYLGMIKQQKHSMVFLKWVTFLIKII